MRTAVTEEDILAVQKVFPIVQAIYHLQMLVHIYKTKGLAYRIPPGLDKESLVFSMQNAQLPREFSIRTRLENYQMEAAFRRVVLSMKYLELTTEAEPDRQYFEPMDGND